MYEDDTDLVAPEGSKDAAAAATATADADADAEAGGDAKKQSAEERQAAMVTKISEALQRGLRVLDDAFDVVFHTEDDLGDVDSEGEGEGEEAAPRPAPAPTYEPKVRQQLGLTAWHEMKGGKWSRHVRRDCMRVPLASCSIDHVALTKHKNHRLESDRQRAVSFLLPADR